MVICENCSHEMNRKGPCLCPECGFIMHEVIKKGYKKRGTKEEGPFVMKIQEIDNGD